MKLEVGIGGHGDKAGHGGAVVVDDSGTIATRGQGSMGIYAYSIGGGGGDGGDASAIDDQIPAIPLVDRVKRFKNLEINVGGAEGATGNGGAVSVTQRGALTTPSISVGGSSSSGGDGGDVTVSAVGGTRILTRGISANADGNATAGGSFGIFAQSVGGGGGVGGNARLQGIPYASDLFPTCEWCQTVSIGIGLPIGKAGGAGGNGGKVSVSVVGDIFTEGDNAAAIFAQSVGGGGGLAGSSGPVPGGRYAGALIGSGGAQGSAGAVNVDVNGIIHTQGAGAHGIFAQSAGGGKALATALADGDLGATASVGLDVTIKVNGQVSADGVDAVGILAHSEGGDGNGKISITQS